MLVTDTQPLNRLGLRALVAAAEDMDIVAEAGTSAECLSAVATTEPDVVFINLTPASGALELAAELRSRYSGLGIVTTGSTEDDVLFRALETGVSAFVANTAPTEELLGAIRHASVAATSFTATGLVNAVTRRRATTDRLGLSPREREVLQLLQQGKSIPMIAGGLFISQSTAKTYVTRLYEKLGVSNRAQALMAGLRHGLITAEKPLEAADLPV
jgi:DNA-binding NarL/FixJ family response regulator